jgi:hypothetical protein
MYPPLVLAALEMKLRSESLGNKNFGVADAEVAAAGGRRESVIENGNPPSETEGNTLKK